MYKCINYVDSKYLYINIKNILNNTLEDVRFFMSIKILLHEKKLSFREIKWLAQG